jgi:hypothetical protein
MSSCISCGAYDISPEYMGMCSTCYIANLRSRLKTETDIMDGKMKVEREYSSNLHIKLTAAKELIRLMGIVADTSVMESEWMEAVRQACYAVDEYRKIYGDEE